MNQIADHTGPNRWMYERPAKGYHSPEHVDALGRLGPSPIHRVSVRPVRKVLGTN
jgi:ribonuclease HII